MDSAAPNDRFPCSRGITLAVIQPLQLFAHFSLRNNFLEDGECVLLWWAPGKPLPMIPKGRGGRRAVGWGRQGR